MANKKHLIDANDFIKHFWQRVHDGEIVTLMDVEHAIINAPTVDAVPVDEIRVDILSLSLENQEVILKVSICGNTNEVKISFSKEVAEVVHGRWIVEKNGVVICSECGAEHEWIDYRASFCEDCGAKMDGGKL